MSSKSSRSSSKARSHSHSHSHSHRSHSHSHSSSNSQPYPSIPSESFDFDEEQNSIRSSRGHSPNSSSGNYSRTSPAPEDVHGSATSASAYDSSTETNILDVPIRVTKYIFTLLPLEELTTCMLVCSAWFNVLSDENINVWRKNCLKRASPELLDSDVLRLCETYKSKLRALIHSWNPHDCSPNGTVRGVTFTRSQTPQTSDGCRGRIGFREGRHVWQIIFMDPLGSCAIVGVATRSTVLSKHGYGPLIGGDRHSWGWNLQGNLLYHKGESFSYYPGDPKIKYKVGDILHCLLDCEDKTLSFKKNGQLLGVAFTDLPVPKKEVFPAISTVYGGSRVSLVYLGTIPDSLARKL